MTALEIVLTSLLGTLILLVIIAAILIRLFNKAMQRRVTSFEVLDGFAPKNPIVFLGDSLTDLYPVHEFIHDDKVLNRGIANQTTYDIKKRLNDIIELNPKAVILLCGINDFLRANVKDPKIVAANIIEIAETLKKTCKQVKLVSLYPINKKRLKLSGFYLRKVTNKKIDEVNSILINHCAHSDVDFVDVRSVLRDENNNLISQYTFEGLHLNFAGYNALTPIYKNILQSVE